MDESLKIQVPQPAKETCVEKRTSREQLVTTCLDRGSHVSIAGRTCACPHVFDLTQDRSNGARKVTPRLGTRDRVSRSGASYSLLVSKVRHSWNPEPGSSTFVRSIFKGSSPRQRPGFDTRATRGLKSFVVQLVVPHRQASITLKIFVEARRGKVKARIQRSGKSQSAFFEASTIQHMSNFTNKHCFEYQDDPSSRLYHVPLPGGTSMSSVERYNVKKPKMSKDVAEVMGQVLPQKAGRLKWVGVPSSSFSSHVSDVTVHTILILSASQNDALKS